MRRLMNSGFSFSRIVIIQSLEAGEIKTGSELRDFIVDIEAVEESGLPVEVVDCEYADQFLEIIRTLAQEASAGSTPLLHVECHGDAEAGLEFANGSTLPWNDLAGALMGLNLATSFNLFAIFSACFGAHFLGQMGITSSAPCYFMLAPTQKIYPDEILTGFKCFYGKLLESDDLGDAMRVITACRLSSGEWFSMPAEGWYEKLVIGYVKTLCSEDVVRNRAKKMHRELRQNGHYKSIGSLLRSLKNQNRSYLDGSHFEKYFMVSQVPNNAERFKEVRFRVASELEVLRRSNLYIL